jgi:hypothetical protein
MPALRVRSKDQQTALTYHFAAITHYSVLFPLMLGVALLTLNTTLAVAATLLGNFVLIGVLPRLRAFRRSVDVSRERGAAAALRLAVLGRMSSAHCEELKVLEDLAASVRRRCEKSGSGAPDASIERWLGLDKLLALYAELAATHQGNTTAFCAQARAGLEREVEQVRWLSLGRNEARDPWLERRRVILQRRQETWQRAADERDFLVQGLATIGGVIRWMQELCTVVVGDSVRAEVEDVLASWESSGATLRELSGLRGHPDIPTVDPRALSLGREVMAQAAARAACRERNAGFTPMSAPPQSVGTLPAQEGAELHACVAVPLSSSASPPGGWHVAPLPQIGFVMRPLSPEAGRWRASTEVERLRESECVEPTPPRCAR